MANVIFFVILAAGSLTAIVTISTSTSFADKCKNDNDNNCNSGDIDQKSWTTNTCDLGNENSDKSIKSFDSNLFACVNTVTNLENLAVIPDQFSETPRWEGMMAPVLAIYSISTNYFTMTWWMDGLIFGWVIYCTELVTI